MAYYLKKTKLKGRTYLSIDESFYSQEKKGTAHKCYKSLGSVETLIKNGMADPVSFYQQEVDRLNSRKKQDGVPMISERSPLPFLRLLPSQKYPRKVRCPQICIPFQSDQRF